MPVIKNKNGQYDAYENYRPISLMTMFSKIFELCVSARIVPLLYSFTCRVINLWNSLSNEIVCCNTVNQFVHKLRAYDLSNFIRGQPFA